MFHLVLFEPEIPPNTGNIIRLCANTNTRLHLIQPLGFSIEDRQLRRAGLDYHEFTTIQEHKNLDAFIQDIGPDRVLACSTRGSQSYTNIAFLPNDAIIFGPETRGLPQDLLANMPESDIIRIPMVPESRSLNLSNAAAIVLYHAWSQHNFPGACNKP